MIDTLGALRDYLAPLDYTTHLFTATASVDGETPPIPYLVLASAAYDRPAGARLCGRDDRLDFPLRVTAVSGVEDAPPKMLDRVFDLLTPKYDTTHLVTATRRIEVTFLRTEVVSQPDRDMTLPRLNRHPSYGVASYRVVSAPLA